MSDYYRRDLAHIHDAGFGGYADSCAAGVLRLLQSESDILEIGCGSGSMTKHLVAAGHHVLATDASRAMLDLVTENVPEAETRILTLPHDPVPNSTTIVSVGHAINYLASSVEIEEAVLKLAGALDKGGLMIIDVCDLSYGETRSGVNHSTATGEGWTMDVTTVFEPPDRFIRGMTTHMEVDNGPTRNDHETHINVLVDVGSVAEKLQMEGYEVRILRSLGDYELPDGIYALLVSRQS